VSWIATNLFEKFTALDAMSHRLVALHFPTGASIQAKVLVLDRVLAEPQLSLQAFCPLIDELLPDVQHSLFASLLEDPYDDLSDFETVVTDLIGQNPLAELFDNPCEPLDQLLRCLKVLVPPGFILTVADAFPLDAEQLIRSCEPDLQRSFAGIASLIRQNSSNPRFLEWIGDTLLPRHWHGEGSARSAAIKLCGIFERKTGMRKKKSLYWAIVTPSNELQMWPVDDPTAPATGFTVDRITGAPRGSSLSIWKSPSELGVKLSTTEQLVRDTWLAPDPPFARSLPFYSQSLPPDLIPAFQSALCDADTFVLQAVIDTMPMATAYDAVQDLFTIFAGWGNVHRLVSTVCALHFAKRSVTGAPDRSHLNALIRFYFQTFGKRLQGQVVRPIVNRIMEMGDLGLKHGERVDVEGVRELLVMALRRILGALELIPNQIRHLAAVLRSYATIYFRGRRHVFEALSDFFYKRFVCASIADSGGSAPDFAALSDLLGPFVRLLQIPLSLELLDNEYRELVNLNDTMIGAFENIYNFVLSAATIDHPAAYERTSQEAMANASKRLLERISQSKTAFIRKYADLSDGHQEKTAAAFAMSDFISKLFR
jgi:hypothetical protein